jgi:hypothetical protein
VRVLFDQGTPSLRSFLVGHEVHEAKAQGWDRLANGALISAAEAGGFEVLVTTDQNMRHQQNLAGRRIAIVVLGKGRWTLIRRRTRQATIAVNAATPGSYTEVEIPE